jgi:hypothetical protein
MVKRDKDAGSEVCEQHTSDRGRSIAPASGLLERDDCVDLD